MKRETETDRDRDRERHRNRKTETDWGGKEKETGGEKTCDDEDAWVPTVLMTLSDLTMAFLILTMSFLILTMVFLILTMAFLILLRKIIERFLFLCLPPCGDRGHDVLGFVPAGRVSSSSTLQIIRDVQATFDGCFSRQPI